MTLQSLLLLSIVVTIALGAGESIAAPGSWVKINGKTYPLTYAYAVPSPNVLPSEKENGTFDIYLVLADAQLPDKFFGDAFWYSHIRRDPKVHGLFFVIDAKNKLIGGGILAGNMEAPDGVWNTPDFAVTASDAQHLEGSGKIAERRLPDGTTVAFDAAFNAARWKAPVERPPTAADAKVAGASAQAKIYLSLLAALKAGNSAAFQEKLSAQGKKEMAGTAAELATRIKILQQMAPANPRALRLTVDGNSSVLEVSDGEAANGTVQFVLEGASWKIGSVD